jgi:EmrB/QacA subfamily drug resistance transporter
VAKEAARSPAVSRRGERLALVVATSASFLTPFMGSATNVALPAIGSEFGLDPVALSWIATAYLLSVAAFLLPAGRIADLSGRKRVFVGGLAVHSATSLLCGLAPSAAWLLAARVAQGVGGAMIFGTAVALLSAVFPEGRRGRALGVNVAAVYLGLTLGPLLGGALTQHLGWRAIFHLNVLVGTLTALAASRGLVGDRPDPSGGLDIAGSALYGAGLVAVMLGLGGLPAGRGVALTAAGLAALGGFVAWEARAAHPVLDIALFRENRVFAFSNLAALVNYAATFAVSFLLSLHLQLVGGLSPQSAGALLAVQPLVQAAVSPFAGRLSDRVEPRLVASTGMAGVAAGLALLAFIGDATPLAFVMSCLTLLGVGFGLFSSPNTNAVMASVEQRLYGVASSTLATMRIVGQMLSMGVAGLILALFVGREAVVPARSPAFLVALRTVFGLFSVLCLAGILPSLARDRAASCAR